MWNQGYGKTDVESGARPLYPMMLESPELRWSFIRKVYSIIAIQLLATIAVGAVVVTVRPIATFFATTGAGLAVYIVLVFVPFISAFNCFRFYHSVLNSLFVFSLTILILVAISALCPLYYYYQRHPINYLLLSIFTLSLAVVVGLSCAFTSGMIHLYVLFYFFTSNFILLIIVEKFAFPCCCVCYSVQILGLIRQC